ncbi:hypothetical protein DAPPUDRAFT_233271 [Daphnia pulex]|uniref:Uncharacterized protein n=1 Tax=Daphnia pulex TaxID=6669 RepID=E9FTN6_DAPPU|nr:hypothetical protein DAPPUDRAFT_233271 [Daphnia pulex]|eukprot:EFX89395.1 hypothetical protein DAPPUDRAFT_233271 [Daphnia pulex]
MNDFVSDVSVGLLVGRSVDGQYSAAFRLPNMVRQKGDKILEFNSIFRQPYPDKSLLKQSTTGIILFESYTSVIHAEVRPRSSLQLMRQLSATETLLQHMSKEK